MRETIQKLLDSELSSLHIAKQTGIEQSTIYRIRTGERTLDNLGFSKAERLYDYQKEMDVMKELEKKVIDNIVVGEVELIEGLHTYFIDIDRADDFDIEFANLNKVDYNDKKLYEVEINKTYEVKYSDQVTQETLSELYDAWLEEDQRSETYIESFYFEHQQDAKDYITKVLKGYETFEQCAKAIGIIE